jgi:pimeloyl-ACP methyl ester carboxylesterase
MKKQGMIKIVVRYASRTLCCSVFAWSPYSYGTEVQADVIAIDHRVPHVSTVPANRKERVELAVRERFVEPKEGKAFRKTVLMVHGASVASPPVFELRVDSYDWAGYLAKSGIDVFMIDHQGSGLSPRPMMDDPCNTNPAQQTDLIPNPLTVPCEVVYKYQLTNAQSDWDELDTVVDYIRAYRNVDKVALVSYSQGSFRVGPYALQHPKKVDSVLFFAPIFNPDGRASKKGTRFKSPVKLPVDSPAAQFGFPMTVTTKARLGSAWSRELGCEGQQKEGIYDEVWAANMENDTIGRMWGPIQADGAPEGRMRVRNQFLWGWNNTTVQFDGTLGGAVPVLIVYGELDTQVSASPFSVISLHSAIPGPNKLMLRLACGGHFMMWERQRWVLHHITRQWLKDGDVDGFTSGSFFVDSEGNLFPQ